MELEQMQFNDLLARWVYLGEGFAGDYNEDDPTDERLLRLDVLAKEDGEWVELDDASSCTLMPYDTPKGILKAALAIILELTDTQIRAGGSVKRVFECLSWMEPEWFDENGALTPAAEEWVSVRDEVRLGTDFDGSWQEEWEEA